jgi:hypothetical protein
MEQRAAEGEAFDVTAYGTLTGHLSRTLNLLGLKREPRDVTPTLKDYLYAAQHPADPEGPDNLDAALEPTGRKSSE